MGLRRRLIIGNLTVAILAALPAGLFLEARLSDTMSIEVERTLGELASTGAALVVDTPPSELDALADILGQDPQLRITMIRRDGVVLGDSDVPKDELDRVANHGDRPEVVAALSGEIGVDRRRSATIDDDMIYVAVPAQGNIIVRASRRAESAQELVGQIRTLLGLGGLLAMGMALVSGVAATRRVGEEMGDLEDHARELSGLSGVRPQRAQGLTGVAESLGASMQRLSQERDRHIATLASMREGVIAIDPQGRIVTINPAAAKLLGDEASLGQPIRKVLPESALNEAAWSEEEAVTVQLAGPPKREVEVRLAALADGDGDVLVLRDVTRVRRLERIRQRFVSNVSHELRTPIGVIRANAESLLDGALEEPMFATRFTEAILRHAKRLTNLVDDLLGLSRIESGQHQLELTPVALDSFIRSMAQNAMERNPGRELPIEVSVDPGAQAYADPRSLTHVVENLLDNAIRYTSGARIQLTAREENRWIRIEVRDEGPGIPEKHRKRIFERFYRVDVGRSRDVGGTGLGLSIVKHLVDAMAGSVWVEPNEPQGTVFAIRLPRQAPSPE